MTERPGERDRRRGARGLALVLAALVLTVGCSSSTGEKADTTPQGSVYVVPETEGWTLREARKPATDDSVVAKVEPGLDWYAEYESYPDPDRPRRVRLSGHDVSIADLERSLAGFDLHTRDVGRFEARVGAGPDGPRVVLLPVADDYTVVNLSYELDVEQLVQWSTSLRMVDEAGWIARGGVVAS